MSSLFNKYSRTARLFPAVICSLPFLLLKFALVDKYFNTEVIAQFWTAVISGVSVWAVAVYFLSQASRFVAKNFFEEKDRFPTLLMLLPSSQEISNEMREKLTLRIRDDFGLTLPTLTDEQSAPEAAKTRINEIVGMIIHKVGQGQLLLQHNAEYGFARNLIGGSVIALGASAADVLLFSFVRENPIALIIALIFMLGYLAPIVLSRWILKTYGTQYAVILFREYLGMK